MTLSETELKYCLMRVRSLLLKEDDDCFAVKANCDLKNICESSSKSLTNELRKSTVSIIGSSCLSLINKSKFLEELDKSIIKSTFECIKEKIRAGKNIGLELIDIADNMRLKDMIHNRTRSLLPLDGLDGLETVFASMALIALECYNGEFYSHVGNYLSLNRMMPQGKLQNKVREAARKFYKKAQDKSRVINTIVSNAIVPKYYLAEFFKFIHGIYRANFEENIVLESGSGDIVYKDLYGYFEQIYEGIGKTLDDSDSNILKVNLSDSDLPTSYTLIKSTKELMADSENRHAIILLSQAIIKIIDHACYNEDPCISNSYLRYGFDEWMKTEPCLRNKSRIRAESSRSSFRADWQPEFFFDEDEEDVFLVPPAHTLSGDYENPDDIYITVTQDGSEIYRSNKHESFKSAFGVKRLIHNKIMISNPLDRIRYTVSDCQGNTLYDSRAQLFRKYIVFGRNGGYDGREIYDNTDYEGVARICCLNNIPDNWDIESEHDCYIIAKGIAVKGGCISIGDDFFNFSRMIKPGIYGEAMDGFSIESDGETIPVYKKTSCVIFESLEKIAHHQIVIDGIRCREADLRRKINERKGVCMYRISLEHLHPGLHEVRISDTIGRRHNRKLFPEKFFLDPDIGQKHYGRGERSYEIKIESSFAEARRAQTIEISDLDRAIITEFEIDGRKLIYHIPFRFKMYRLIDGTDASWRTYEEDIRKSDLTIRSRIQLCGIEADNIAVFSGNNEKLYDIRIERRDGFLTADISALDVLKGKHDMIRLDIRKGASTVKSLKCFMRCVINRADLEYDDVRKDFYLKADFSGEGSVLCVIKKQNADLEAVEISKITDMKSGNEYFNTGVTPDGTYVFDFYEISAGRLRADKRLIRSYRKTFPNLDDIISDKDYYVHRFVFTEWNSGKERRLWSNSNDYRIRLSEPDSSGKCKGCLFMKSDKRHIPWRELCNLNPVTVELFQASEKLKECNESYNAYKTDDDYKFEVYMRRNSGDGILLDPDRLELIENEDSDDERLVRLPDVFRYEIAENILGKVK